MKTKNLPKNWDEKINVKEAFEFLKEKDLINKKRSLKESSVLDDFKSSFFGKKIYYPEKFKKRKIRKDKIFFVLLHEEGHNNVFPWQKIIIFSGIIAGIFSGIYSDLKGLGNIFLFTFGGFLIPIYLLMPLAKKEEYNADNWAVSKMINEFNFENPSKILKDIFSKNGKKSKFTTKEKTFGFLRTIFPCHPSPNKRILNVKSIENEK